MFLHTYQNIQNITKQPQQQELIVEYSPLQRDNQGKVQSFPNPNNGSRSRHDNRKAFERAEWKEMPNWDSTCRENSPLSLRQTNVRKKVTKSFENVLLKKSRVNSYVLFSRHKIGCKIKEVKFIK